MEKYLHVEILTPFGKYLKCDADFLSVTSSVAVLGLLPNHSPLITTLETSKLSIKIGNNVTNYAIGGGVLHIKKNSEVKLLLNSIERKDEIDIKRAIEAKERAEALLLNKNNVDITRAKSSLARALNRINIYNEK